MPRTSIHGRASTHVYAAGSSETSAPVGHRGDQNGLELSILQQVERRAGGLRETTRICGVLDRRCARANSTQTER